MEYALLIFGEDTTYAAMSEEEQKELVRSYDDFTEKLRKAKAYRGSVRLYDATTATTRRIRPGQVLTTDGPFAETKEQLRGTYLIEAADLDGALVWADQVPGARLGSVEVRPIRMADLD